mgnify:FL=1
MSLKHLLRCAFKDALKAVDLPVLVGNPRFSAITVTAGTGHKRSLRASLQDDVQVDGEVSLSEHGGYAAVVVCVIAFGDVSYPYTWHHGYLPRSRR